MKLRRTPAVDPAQRSLFADTEFAVGLSPASGLAVVVPAVDAGPAAEVGPAIVPAPCSPAARLPQHPQAVREFVVGDVRIGYAFRRAHRHSIGFVVGPEGLSVSAPKWVGLREVDAALREKGDWIVRKLAEQQERSRRLAATKIEWRDGATLPFLGETVVIALDAQVGSVPGGVLLEASDVASSSGRRHALRIGLPPRARPVQIRDAVQSWLQRQARRVFEERCRLYAGRLGVRMTRLALSSAQTRWGSANASGAIRLNWRLIHFALPTIDYVVAHELAHLREMNHSPRFWDVVRSVLPDYEQARGALKHDALPVFE